MLVLFVAWCSVGFAAAAVDPLTPIRLKPKSHSLPPLPPHPRLLALPADIARLNKAIGSSAEAAAAFAKLALHGECIISGNRSCHNSNSATSLDLVYSLGLLHRLDGNITTKWSEFALKYFDHELQSADIARACGGNCSVLEAKGGDNSRPRQMGLKSGILAQQLGIAYDWFHHAMSAAQKKKMKDVIVTQILNLYAEGLSAAFVGEIWWRTSGNFNGCINGGAFIAALAVMDEPGPAAGGAGIPGSTTKQFAHDVIQLSLESMLRLQGGITIFKEGYDYGSFGFGNYLAAVRAAETAFGQDSTIAKMLAPKHEELARNRLYNIGPTGQLFSWADSATCSQNPVLGCYSGANTNEWQSMAMARRNKDKAMAYVARQRALDPLSPCETQDPQSGHLKYDCAMALLEWTNLGSKQDLEAVPLVKRYNFTQTGFLLSSWSSPTASYVAFKGGDNALQQLHKDTTHSHADQGSFVFDQLGYRWANDLGNVAPSGYSSKGYFAMQKFDVFGPRTLSHNTLTFAPADCKQPDYESARCAPSQDACTEQGSAKGLSPLFDTTRTPIKQDATTCEAKISEFSTDETRSFGIVNLADSYTLSAPGARMMRGLALLPAKYQRSLLVVDEGAQHVLPQNDTLLLQWHLHTFANVSCGKGFCTLLATSNQSKGVAVDVAIADSGCPGSVFTVAEVQNMANRSAMGFKDLGQRRLTLTAPAKSCRALAVAIGPRAGIWAKRLAVNALGDWARQGPVS